jgi:two-component system, sensor histidine kinase
MSRPLLFCSSRMAWWRRGAAMARRRTKKKAAVKPARRRAPRRKLRSPTGAAVAAFAHDIRTALTGILAFGELLASSNLGERERRWAAAIKESAEHLAALTTLGIDAGKTETGALTLRAISFAPRRLLEALADSLIARAEAKGLHAEVSLADDLPDVVLGDPARLRAALENLIDNAVKFTESGEVKLTAHRQPAARGRVKLVVTVSDSGIGLNTAEIKRLFRPYAQANAEVARRYGGTGLGLVVVKQLAKLMGGDVTVTSKPGRGSTFCFTAVLPLAPAADAPILRVSPAEPSRGLSVLCVEDNPYGRVILNAILGEFGHKADFVGSGEEAVAAAARGYDAMLMDVTLPGIDGYEATRRIRALAGAAAATPIIGISGRSEASDQDAARAAGMNYYLHKPLSPSVLADALALVVGNRRSGAGPP